MARGRRRMHRGSIMSTCCKTFGLQLHRGYESVTASRAHLMKAAAMMRRSEATRRRGGRQRTSATACGPPPACCRGNPYAAPRGCASSPTVKLLGGPLHPGITSGRASRSSQRQARASGRCSWFRMTTRRRCCRPPSGPMCWRRRRRRFWAPRRKTMQIPTSSRLLVLALATRSSRSVPCAASTSTLAPTSPLGCSCMPFIKRPRSHHTCGCGERTRQSSRWKQQTSAKIQPSGWGWAI
mmetsp:Transcript_10790/g.32396  ORF Transcript_10790/g.32396 Transcript_10790/m.32396 type:complete len:239 (-) Transcript_10790:3738-4454(-)